jgi:hypothetical protein
MHMPPPAFTPMLGSANNTWKTEVDEVVQTIPKNQSNENKNLQYEGINIHILVTKQMFY